METEADITGNLQVGVGYIVYISAVDAVAGVDCGPDQVTTAQLYLHVMNGGTTYETRTVDDTSAGALVV